MFLQTVVEGEQAQIAGRLVFTMKECQRFLEVWHFKMLAPMVHLHSKVL
jgi:hypothetical protein